MARRRLDLSGLRPSKLTPKGVVLVARETGLTPLTGPLLGTVVEDKIISREYSRSVGT